MLTSGNNAVSVPIINAPFIVDESVNQTAVNNIPQNRFESIFPSLQLRSQLRDAAGVSDSIRTW